MTLKRPLSPPAKPRRAGTAIDDDAWLDVLLALKVYRLLYGHCKVPLSFFVPRLDHTPTAWPLHLTGMRLGAAVKTLRTCYLPEHFVSALDAIGFVWRQDGRLIPTGTSLFDEIDAVPFAAMITALEVHVATHQTTKIPAHATFMHTSVWHRSWTYVLADVVPALEAHFYQLSDVQMARLRDLGYCKQLPLWDDLMDLLRRYYEHVVPPGSGVAIDFVVPPDATAWPSQWHGLELGLLFWSVGLTHTTTLSESRRRDLKTHTFVFNTVHTWAKVLDALTTYDSVSTKPSCFEMWRSYVTPTSAPWPAALRGYPLGRWYTVMCDAETNLLLPYRTQEALVGLRGGLRLLPQELMTESTTAQAYWDAFLTAYKCIHRNAATIPPKFVMPSSESVPKVAHGFLLGAAIASVRNHVLLHPAHRAALDKLGLAWATSVPAPAAATPKHRSYRWPEKVRALERYKELHGHCDVPVSFVVPSSRDWPQDLHGCRLGYLVARFHSELSSIPAEYKPVIAGLTGALLPTPVRTDSQSIATPRVGAITGRASTSKDTHAVTDASTGSSSSNPFVYDMASSNSEDDASDEEDDLDWSPPERKRPRISSPVDALSEPEPEAAAPRRTTVTDLSPPIAPPRPTVEIPQPEPANDMTRRRPLSPPAKPRRAGTAIDDDAWLDVLLALKVYRLLYGHCKVPLSFFVPRLDHTPTAWPLHLTGMHLGAAVKTLRTCYLPERFVSALDAIGFVWRQDGRLIPTGTSLFDEIDAVPFAAMITALEVHVATHQTTKIPAHATFMHTSVWHRSWTYVLADVVPALEAHFYQLSDVQMARLRDLGYCKQLPLWDDLMDLLQRYYEHVVPPGSGVAIDFVVPPDATAWPSQWHGLELGLLFWSVGLTHTTTLSESRRRDLKTHKFVFNTVHTWAKVLDALTTYDSVSTKPSCFEMWRSYVTPTSAPWPEALRGYPLGRWYKVMCDAETNLLLPYLTQDALVGLRGGLRLLPQELMTESTTAQAYWDAFLTAYKCIHRNAATIPPKFVMPSSESVPKVAHGFLLGAAIASVRNHVLLHPAHRAALDKLGLAWATSVPEAAATEPVEIVEWVPTPRPRYYRWPDKMRALEAFKEAYGHCGVPTAFVVPGSNEWPEDLHGCRLGALVSRFFAEPRSVPAEYAPLISALGVVSVPGDTIVAPTVDADGTVVKAFAGSDADTASDSSDADTASDSSDAPMDVTTHDDATVTDGERLTDATMVAVSTDDADEDPPVDMSDDASDNDGDVSGNDDDTSDNNEVLCGSLPPVSSPVVYREPEPDAPSWTTTCALSHSAQMTQEAANVYYELTGHRHISSSFRVPPDDMRWPMHLWDWPLGQAWMHLHRRAPSLNVNWDSLLLALGIYARATGHGHVPRHFVVPDDVRTWPVHLTGFDLGELVHCIRSGRVSLSHAHAVALSAMDFEWTAP